MRLTKHQKSTIITKFVDYTFGKQELDLKTQEHISAEKIYELKYDQATRNRINSLPDGWLHKYSRIMSNIGGYNYGWNFSQPKRFLLDYPERVVVSDQLLIITLQKHMHASEKLRSYKLDFKNKMFSFLANINTDKQLLDAMPEASTILGPNFLGVAIPCTALVTTAKEILCVVAKGRNEERDGCCDGKLVEEI